MKTFHLSIRDDPDITLATDSLAPDGDECMKLASDAVVFGGGSSPSDYNDLKNKPSIEGVELSGDKSFGQLGLSGSENVGFDDGVITVDGLTAAQVAALLTDD